MSQREKSEVGLDWPSQNPSEGFAARIVERAMAERRGVRTPRKFRRVIPLLLAGVLLSAAAAAYSHLEGERTQIEAIEENDSLTLTTPRVEFHARQTQSELVAEKDQIRSPGKRRIPHAEEAPAHQVEPAPPSNVPPGTLHLPRCECGTSAVICTCIE